MTAFLSSGKEIQRTPEQDIDEFGSVINVDILGNSRKLLTEVYGTIKIWSLSPMDLRKFKGEYYIDKENIIVVQDVEQPEKSWHMDN